jgi:hypothetical protein
MDIIGVEVKNTIVKPVVVISHFAPNQKATMQRKNKP